MVNPDKIYPPLPPAENVTPLVRIPEPMSLTEKNGGTEYTVNALMTGNNRQQKIKFMCNSCFQKRCSEGSWRL